MEYSPGTLAFTVLSVINRVAKSPSRLSVAFTPGSVNSYPACVSNSVSPINSITGGT